MGIWTVEDLLLHFPRTYEDLSESKNLGQVKTGEKVSMPGRLFGMKTVPTKNRKVNLIKAMFYDAYGNSAEVVGLISLL